MVILVLKFAARTNGSDCSKIVILTAFELEPFSLLTVKLTMSFLE